jgi:hypothetical protein
MIKLFLKKFEIFLYSVYRLGYELDDPEFESRERQEEFLLSKSLTGVWGAPSLQLSGYCSLFPGVKRPGCCVDHSSSNRTEIMNEWSYASAPPMHLNGLEMNIFLLSMISK